MRQLNMYSLSEKIYSCSVGLVTYCIKGLMFSFSLNIVYFIKLFYMLYMYTIFIKNMRACASEKGRIKETR